MAKHRKETADARSPESTSGRNPIEEFASLLGPLEAGEREEKIALYMEELEKDPETKDPAQLLREARSKARQILREKGLEYSAEDSEADPFSGFTGVSLSEEQDSKGTNGAFETEQTVPYRGKTGKGRGLPTAQLAVIAALVVVVIVLVAVVVGVFLRPLFSGTGDAGSDNVPAQTQQEDGTEATGPEAEAGELYVPEGIENASSVTLELADGEYKIVAGDEFAIEGAEQFHLVQNVMDGENWLFSADQGEVTVTVPAGLQSVSVSISGARATLENVQADTLSFAAQDGSLTLSGIKAGQLELKAERTSVEVQAEEIQTAVTMTLKNGTVGMVMPAPQEYGYNVSCTNGMVRVGSTPYLTENTAENEGAPFQYHVECETGTVEIDLAADSTGQGAPADNSSSVAAAEGGAESGD